MDRDGWGCGVVREQLYGARCLVLPVCVCLWNNTAAYREGSIEKKQQQPLSPSCGGSHLSHAMVKVGNTLLLIRFPIAVAADKNLPHNFYSEQ
jgi:hypothetical protein